jgi:signal transduction histidine kinase
MFQLESTSHLAQCPPPVQQGLSIARNMVAFSRNEVRHAVQDLHSPILDTFDLETALKHIVAQTGVHQVASSVKVSGAPYSLGKTIEHHLLRVAQEAVANAIKHAQASAIEVKLHYAPDAVELTVSDNGRGFDTLPVTDGATHHFGLRSLRGRANKLGGRLDVESTVGRGTTVRLTVARPEFTDDPISPMPQADS